MLRPIDIFLADTYILHATLHMFFVAHRNVLPATLETSFLAHTHGGKTIVL